LVFIFMAWNQTLTETEYYLALSDIFLFEIFDKPVLKHDILEE